MRKFRVVLFAVVFSLLIAAAAQAGVDSPIAIDNVPNVFGVGVGMAPQYLGSKNYELVAAPFFRWTFQGSERYLQLLATELSFNIVNDPNWVLGPVLNYRPGRSDVDNTVVSRMKDIDATADAGVTAGYVWKDPKNTRHRFIVTLEYLMDVGDVYNGWLVQGGIRYWYPVSMPIDLQVGVGTTYGNSQYMNTYFGVTAENSLRSGLPRYTADAGFRDWNAQVAMVFHFSKNWHLAAGVKYYDLLSQAADSPIVSDVGTRNQLIAGLGVAYSW